MIILGINASHCATAALLKDGKILSCISEERLTGVKNQSGLPIKAIEKALTESRLKSSDVDKVAFSFEDMAINSGFSVLGGDEGKNKITLGSVVWYAKEWLLANINFTRYIYPVVQKIFYTYFVFPQLKERLLEKFF